MTSTTQPSHSHSFAELVEQPKQELAFKPQQPGLIRRRMPIAVVVGQQD
jgi:hypothetical protein